MLIKRAHECDCETCSGGQSAPAGHYGGSWKCMCPCHRKESGVAKEVSDLSRDAEYLTLLYYRGESW